MGIKIKWETAENMMNIVAFTACQSFIANNEELDLEAIQQFARDTFKEYCEAMGITEVEEPEDFNEDDFDEDYLDFNFDNDEDDEEEDDEDNSYQYSLIIKDDFVLRYMEAGHTFEEACEIADLLFGEGE